MNCYYFAFKQLMTEKIHSQCKCHENTYKYITFRPDSNGIDLKTFKKVLPQI